MIKLNGAVVCWGSRKQTLTSVSSTEEEYVAISEMCKEILFIKSVLEFIEKMTINLPILIFCDNEGAIYLSNNHESRRTKHIDTKIHFIRDYVENGTVIIKFIASEDNLLSPLFSVMFDVF